MASFFNLLPDDIQSEVFEFLYDRKLKQKCLNELKRRTECYGCDCYLTPSFCKNGANFCSLSCYLKDENDNYIDEYLEELAYLARGNGVSYFGP